MFIRQLQIFGSTLGTQDEFRALLDIVAAGQLQPVIDRQYDFVDARQALDDLDAARQCGKLVLKIKP